MKSTSSIAFGIAAFLLLAQPVTSGRQQPRQPSGIGGLPVEGHDIVGAVVIVGTRQIDVQKMRERLRANGAELRLGRPLETQTLCRFVEVLRDAMREKGFPGAEITHETGPTYGNRRHLTLTFTIVEGTRTRGVAAPEGPLSPAQRCSR
jgi:outer membrane protein assembly factor BamA